MIGSDFEPGLEGLDEAPGASREPEKVDTDPQQPTPDKRIIKRLFTGLEDIQI